MQRGRVAGRRDQPGGMAEAVAGRLGERGDGALGEFGMGADAGADRSAAKVHLEQRLGRAAQAFGGGDALVGPGAQLGLGADHDGVLQLGAAELDDADVGVGALGQLRGEAAERCVDRRLALDQGQPQRRRVDVVGRLRAVHVVVGMAVGVLARLAPEQLQRAVGDHLVHVHVGRGAGAALDDRHGQRRQQLRLTRRELRAGPLQRLGQRRFDHPERRVGAGGRQLHRAERAAELGHVADPVAEPGEVFQRPLGLQAVEGRVGEATLADQIALDPDAGTHTASRTRSSRSWALRAWPGSRSASAIATIVGAICSVPDPVTSW